MIRNIWREHMASFTVEIPIIYHKVTYHWQHTFSKGKSPHMVSPDMGVKNPFSSIFFSLSFYKSSRSLREDSNQNRVVPLHQQSVKSTISIPARPSRTGSARFTAIRSVLGRFQTLGGICTFWPPNRPNSGRVPLAVVRRQ